MKKRVKRLKGKYHCKGGKSQRSPTKFLFGDKTEIQGLVCLPGIANAIEYEFFDRGNGKPQIINIFTIDQKQN